MLLEKYRQVYAGDDSAGNTTKGRIDTLHRSIHQHKGKQGKSSISLHEQMEKICEMSVEERKAMGLAGREHMEDVFDQKKVVAKTMTHFG